MSASRRGRISRINPRSFACSKTPGGRINPSQSVSPGRPETRCQLAPEGFGQGSTEGAHRPLKRRNSERGEHPDEIARRGGPRREIRGGGAIDRRRRRLPGDALIKLEAGVRLGHEVPVRHRLEIFVPGGWFPRRGDRRPLGRLSDAGERALPRKAPVRMRVMSGIGDRAVVGIYRADVSSGSRDPCLGPYHRTSVQREIRQGVCTARRTQRPAAIKTLHCAGVGKKHGSRVSGAIQEPES